MNTMVIPGTRSIVHLEQNRAAGELGLPVEARARLDAVGSREAQRHGAEFFLAE